MNVFVYGTHRHAFLKVNLDQKQNGNGLNFTDFYGLVCTRDKEMDIFKNIIPHYCEPHRHYHNLHHLMNMFEAHEKYKASIPIIWDSTIEQKLYHAIIFHDVIYDIKKDGKSNEVKSAELYKARLGDAHDQYVYDMILATEFHFTDNEYDILTSYFLDLDLITLATNDEKYLIETQVNIDKEFLTEYSKDEVYTKRYEFIKDYMQPYARIRMLPKELEDQMKNNINTLLKFYSPRTFY